MKGKIYSIISGKYHIYCKEDDSLHILPALGVFRHKEIIPLVGDQVEFIKNEYLTQVYPRKNQLVRPKVANVDQGIIVMSVLQPTFSSYLVDKYLAILETNNIEPIIIFSKTDLLQEENKWKREYEQLGYKVFEINQNQIPINQWKDIFYQKTSVLIGQSGVGKTTFLNKLGNFNFDTAQISFALNRGKHTTRVVKIVPFLGGEIIDTPGFSSIDLKMYEICKQDLAKSFKIFKQASSECSFTSCLHFKEPEHLCYVKQQVKENKIPEFRYLNYLKMLKEIE